MISDFLKGALGFVGGVAWGLIAAKLVPNTRMGVAIVLVPFGVLVLTGAFFMLRGQFKNLL